DAELAAHDPALGLNRVHRQPTALEDPVVSLPVRLEAPFDAVLVAVERVGVLHDELAHPEEPAARPRLVAVLDREVVPELRQLPVRADLTRQERECLLVRHGKYEAPPRTVGDVEDLGDPGAAGRLPELDRREERREELLAADPVHLLADDLLDLPVDAP